MASMDFFGFSFKGYHSSNLGIMRVSDGSRYNDTIIPAFQDKTVAVPGGDGTYFFESFYTNTTFNVNIAFDDLTEAQFRQLRQVFNGKEVGDLIFDEAPYKAYTVKVQSPPQLKYICFDMEVEDQSTTTTILHNHDLYTHSPASADTAPTSPGRVYKGEGTIQFIGYKPYAHSVHKYLSAYSDTNKSEWSAASHMRDSQGDFDRPGATVPVYNGGDIDTDFCIFFPLSNSNTLASIELKDSTATTTYHGLYFNAITTASNDVYLRVNTKTNLVEGCDSNFKPTGTLYNQYISAGDFFKIPVCSSLSEYYKIVSNTTCSKIEYDYLYY